MEIPNWLIVTGTILTIVYVIAGFVIGYFEIRRNKNRHKIVLSLFKSFESSIFNRHNHKFYMKNIDNLKHLNDSLFDKPDLSYINNLKWKTENGKYNINYRDRPIRTNAENEEEEESTHNNKNKIKVKSYDKESLKYKKI